jgi:hypothetical protein
MSGDRIAEWAPMINVSESTNRFVVVMGGAPLPACTWITE